MAIRLRYVDGVLVACCAARSVEKPGDIYLDDAVHYALSMKFGTDLNSWYAMEPETLLREREESNNPNRSEWDATFGDPGSAA